MASRADLEKAIDRVLKVLVASGETNWSETLRAALEQCRNATRNDETQEVARSIRSLYGAMGSFSDLVLFKDGRVLHAENDELEEARNRLFDVAGSVR